MGDYYQLVEIILGGKSCYTIWFSKDNAEEEDGILMLADQLAVFETLEEAEDYALEQQIDLDDEVFSVNVDDIAAWADSEDSSVDCVEALCFWNLVWDVTASNGLDFLGNERTEEMDHIYDELFKGNNVLVENDEEAYTPVWSSDEIALIKKVMLDGAEVVKKSVAR